MHTNPAADDDSGLSDSAYELVYGTDSESQDGNYEESLISESVGSLDLLPRDDTQELGATEHDEEEDDNDDSESLIAEQPVLELQEPCDTSIEDQTVLPAQDDADNTDESENESRSSLEYTRQSLGTPSMMTPEASKVLSPVMSKQHNDIEDSGSTANVEQHREMSNLADYIRAFSNRIDITGWLYTLPSGGDDQQIRSNTTSGTAASSSDEQEKPRLSNAWGQLTYPLRANAASHAREFLADFLIGSATILCVCVVFGVVNMAAGPGGSGSTLMVNMTTTSTTILTTSTPTTAMTQAVGASTGVGLIPLHEAHEAEWLFGYRAPTVTFTSEADDKVMISVEPVIPKSWLSKDGCAVIDAKRGGERVPMQWNIVKPTAILIDFPKEEAFGVVQVTLIADCRPRFQKAVKVHFSKGSILDEFSDLILDFARKIEEFIPDPALTSDSFFEFLQQSAMDFAQKLISFSHLMSPSALQERSTIVMEAFRNHLHKAKSSTLPLLSDIPKIRHHFFGYTPKEDISRELTRLAHQVDLGMRLSILEAQVAAKQWWLNISGRSKQAEEYRRKAETYIRDHEVRWMQKHGQNYWSRKNRENMGRGRLSRPPKACKESGRGRRGTHQCVPAA